MTSVNASGASNIESWMVSKLFGAEGTDQSSDSAVATTATSVATVAAGIGTSVSGTTAQALTTLKTGGSLPAFAPPPSGVDRPLMSVAQSNATIQANNALSSDQINAAMYGGGLRPGSGFLDSPNATFADFLAQGRANVDDMRKLAEDPAYSDAERQDVLATAQADETMYNSIEAAYANHTVVFQKSSDVAGLDYTGMPRLTNQSGPGGTEDPNKPPSGTGLPSNVSYNHAFFATRNDNMNHMFFDLGSGVDIYASWPK